MWLSRRAESKAESEPPEHEKERVVLGMDESEAKQ